jgi:uncharacterized RDD family membrane protein YckC
MDQEQIFKLVFFLAFIVFCITIVGFFLLGIKIWLLFTPEVKLAGMSIKNIVDGIAR